MKVLESNHKTRRRAKICTILRVLFIILVLLDFFHNECLEDVAYLDIKTLFKSDTALVAGCNLTNVVLETSEGGDLVFHDYDTVANDTNLRLVNSLPREYRVPFSMHISGFKYREIAEKLGLPLGTVKSRIFFTRQKLQQELKDFI